jgi:ribonuclease D
MTCTIIESTNDLPADAQFPNGMAAIDTETLGLKITRDRLCLCQISNGEGTVWLIKFDGTDYSAPNLNKLLANPRILKLFHFARFDIAVLAHYVGTMTEGIYCTKIASRLTRTYSDRHGLKALVEELLDIPVSKEQQMSNWASPTLTEAQKSYAAADVLYLHNLKKILDERLRDMNRIDHDNAHSSNAFSHCSLFN